MKVKGYYNIHNGVFLGPMTAQNDKGVAFTPRYVEGVCFGEYDTITEEFIPHTNPMIIPKGSVMEIDEDQDAFVQGQHKLNVTGIEEDKGLDIAVKRNQVVMDLKSKRQRYAERKAQENGEEAPVIKEAKEPVFFDKQELKAVSDIDFDKLF